MVRSGDGAALVALFAACSPETVFQRFFGLPAAFPPSYLAAVLAGRPPVHDAVVVRFGDGLHVAGLASLAAAPSGEPAELGVLVADAWQHRGLGAALVETLVARARDRGVDRLAATVLPTRPGLLRALGRRLDLEYVTPSADSLTGLYMLSDTTVADPVRSDAAVRR